MGQHSFTEVFPFLPDEKIYLMSARSCNIIASYFAYFFFNQVKPFSANVMFREETMEFPVKRVLHVVKLVNQDFITRITLRTISDQNSSEFYPGYLASAK